MITTATGRPQFRQGDDASVRWEVGNTQMEFDPAFALLKKFTAGVPDSTSGSETVDSRQVAAVAKYLGIALPQVSLSECISIIESELLVQNEFLTTRLEDDDIMRAELYEKSQFVREVVLNNRKKSQLR